MKKHGTTLKKELNNMLTNLIRGVFELGDWLWLYMRKKLFLVQRCSKLLPREYGIFQILKGPITTPTS